MSDRPARAWSTAYHAAWVLPIAGEPIRDGTVVVEGDRIAWVGQRTEMPRGAHAHAPRDVELGDLLLTPGLVNAHTHLDLTVMRGLFDGESFFGWIRGVVAARDLLSADEERNSARAGIIEGLEAGITTFADTAPGHAAFDAMCDLGVRGIAFLEVFGPDPAQCDHAMSGLAARVDSLRPRETALVRVGVSPHAPYSVSDALYAAVAAYARRESLPIAAHIAESDAESQLVAGAIGPFADFLKHRGIAVAPRGRSPVAMLGAAGMLGRDVLLIHCVRCDTADVAAIADSGAAVVTCPQSNRYFAHGRAPTQAFLSAGVRVAVGSDSMASNLRMDLLAEARAALGTGAASWRGPWELATIGGARALGLDAVIGTLEVGKQADLAAFPVGRGVGSGATPPFGIPEHGSAQLVVVAGVERLREGRLVGDRAAIVAPVAAAAARLREWRVRARAT